MQPSLSVVSNDDPYALPSDAPTNAASEPEVISPVRQPAQSPLPKASPARRQGLGGFAVVLIAAFTALIVGGVAGVGG